MSKYYIYMMSNKKNGVIYTGITNDLKRRISEHKEGLSPGFTRKYHAKSLVYFEDFDSNSQAIEREKQLKNWKRQWKIDLIEENNPEWDDLFVGL